MPILTRRHFLGSLAAGSAMSPSLRGKNPPVHWALLADTHISQDRNNEYQGFRPYDNLSKVIPQVLKAAPEGVLIAGDLARLVGLPGDYAVLKTLLDPLSAKAPLALAMGNHDDRKNFLDVFATPAGMLQPVKKKYVLVAHTPVAQFVILDSLQGVNCSGGLLGKAQSQWLEAYLKNSPDVPAILVLHHTLEDEDYSLYDAHRLFQIAKPARKVKAIVCGHSHSYSCSIEDGIHVVLLPAVGYAYKEPVGWVDGVFTSEGADLTLRAIGGVTTQDGKTTSLRWRA